MESEQEMTFETYKKYVFERLEELSRIPNPSEAERYQYDRLLKWSRDYNTAIGYARKEGYRKGLEESRKEISRKSLEAESQEYLKNIARKMKKAGSDNGLIAEITALSLCEINNL